MLEYERIDISEGNDVDMSDKSKECMLYHYWYFLNKNFSYGPYLCDDCYNLKQKCNEFKNVAIVHVKKSIYGVYFRYLSKGEAKKLMNNSNLIDKKDVLYKKNYFVYKMGNTTYYQRNRDIALNKAKEYYKNNNERLKKQARDKYRNLSEEDKNKKREYGKNRYHNMSEEKRISKTKISRSKRV